MTFVLTLFHYTVYYFTFVFLGLPLTLVLYLLLRNFPFLALDFLCSILYKSIMIMYKVANNSAIGACLDLHNGRAWSNNWKVIAWRDRT